MLPEGRWLELMIAAVVALVVVGPKDLPILLRKLGQFMARVRSMAAEFRASFDEMARQSELDELRKEVEAMRKAQLSDIAAQVATPEVHQTFNDLSQGLTDVGVDLNAAVTDPYTPAATEPIAVTKPTTPKRVRKASAGAAPAKTQARARKTPAKAAATKAAPKRAPAKAAGATAPAKAPPKRAPAKAAAATAPAKPARRKAAEPTAAPARRRKSVGTVS